MTSTPAVKIAEVPIHAVNLEAAADAIVETAIRREHLTVHLCNAYVLALASRDTDYGDLLARGDLNLADGAPVAWFASRAGVDLRMRPSGAELFEEVIRRSRRGGLRHYLYGSTPEVVSALSEALAARHPGLKLAGVESPPFGPVTDEQADALAIAAASADAHVIWIGLGTPKQDMLVARMRHRFNGPCIPVGAAFDFLAGTMPRAPRWMRRVGLEWVYRLAKEPRRLGRRYLWGNVRFLWVLARTGRILDNTDDSTA